MKPINALKERLSKENTIVVQNERGFIMETEFFWAEPALDSEIDQFEKNLGFKLPLSFKDFLRKSNGATLFRDKKYGQWGCKIYGLSNIIKINQEVRIWRNLPESWLVFATWIGDQDMLIFDLNKINEGGYIIYGDECDSVDEFEYINGNFEKWIDRLIVSQGSKYWRW